MKNVTESITLIVDQRINCSNINAVANLAAEGDLEIKKRFIEWACEKTTNELGKVYSSKALVSSTRLCRYIAASNS